jgi:hypothetical protein
LPRFNKIKIPLILSVSWIFIFGSFQIGMDMTMDGKAYCPFGGHSMVICQMNPLEHIQEWQSMFTTLPAKDMISIFSAFLSLLALLALRFLNTPFLFKKSRLEKYANIFYLNRAPIFNPLQEAFSRGILNPKLF